MVESVYVMMNFKVVHNGNAVKLAGTNHSYFVKV
jgi:hypothetical protein